MSFGAFGGSGGRRSRARFLDIVIHHVLQLFAGLEEGNLLGRHFHSVAGFGVAADAWFALTGAEAAEAANLNFVACAQGTHHAVKDGFHDHFTVFAREFRQMRDFIDEIGFRNISLLAPGPA